MRRTLWALTAAVLFVGVPAVEAIADPLPDFQVFAEGAVLCPDGVMTWCVTDPSFTLIIAAGFGPAARMRPSQWNHITVVFSYPEGSTGAIALTPVPLGGITPATPMLLRSKDSFPVGNPTADADYDGLTNVPGVDSYLTKRFLPGPRLEPFGDHDSFADPLSEFALFGLAPEVTTADALAFSGDCLSYDAGTGIITNESPDQRCVELHYTVRLSGFAGRVHIDVYGFNADRGSWRMNVFGHDTEWRVPEADTTVLAGIALFVMLGSRRRLAARVLRSRLG